MKEFCVAVVGEVALGLCIVAMIVVLILLLHHHLKQRSTRKAATRNDNIVQHYSHLKSDQSEYPPHSDVTGDDEVFSVHY